MDIILTNTIIATILIGIVLLTFLRFYLKTRQKKYNILLIKKYGGVSLTDKEKRFLSGNSKLKYTNKIRRKRFSFKDISMKKFKERMKSLSNTLNPKWHKSKIDTLEKDLSYQNVRIGDLRRNMDTFKTDVTNQFIALKPVPKKKPVVNKKPKENVSSLSNINLARKNNSFI